MKTHTKSEAACLHVLRQITRDDRLAYLIGPFSRSYELLIEAVAETEGKTSEVLRAEIEPNLRIAKIRVVESEEA